MGLAPQLPESPALRQHDPCLDNLCVPLVSAARKPRSSLPAGSSEEARRILGQWVSVRTRARDGRAPHPGGHENARARARHGGEPELLHFRRGHGRALRASEVDDIVCAPLTGLKEQGSRVIIIERVHGAPVNSPSSSRCRRPGRKIATRPSTRRHAPGRLKAYLVEE